MTLSACVQRLEFVPTQPTGLWRALLLALLAHALLMGALTWGVSWHHSATMDAVQAELWAELPQAQVPAPPPPEPEPEPEPKAPTPPAPEVAPPAVTPEPDIALERERIKQQQLALERERQAQWERDQAKAAKQVAADKLRSADLAREADKKAQASAKAKLDQATAQALDKQRQANLQRLAALAGATGGATATGTATHSAGPSASYGARIAARIKPNIVFTEEVAGNPTADVEVRTAPDGTIVGRNLVKSSGSKAWDEAVLKAIDKTERLPRDVDGSVQPSLVIGFRPKD